LIRVTIVSRPPVQEFGDDDEAAGGAGGVGATGSADEQHILSDITEGEMYSAAFYPCVSAS